MRAEIVDRDPAVTKPMRGILFTWASAETPSASRMAQRTTINVLFTVLLTPHAGACPEHNRSASRLLDHSIRPRQHGRRDCEIQSVRGVEIEHQVISRRFIYR